MNSSDLIFENRYICQNEVKAGAFGIVYQGFDVMEKRQIAIKLEKNKKSHSTSSLTNEARILSKLKGIKGIPDLYWSGKNPGTDDRALVMTFLGKDLQTQFTRLKGFTLKTVLMCGVQLLKILQLTHEKGVVHRDIKPDNILTCYDEDDMPTKVKGLNNDKELNQIYLCDFGISKIFRENNKHIDYKINKPFIGTIRFASEAAHKGLEVSRKDDLESLGYVLIFLYKGKLPWQNVDKALGNLRQNRVGTCKQLENLLEYFYDMPDEFLQYFKYVKGLTFKENPNYDYLIGLMKELAKKKNLNIEDLQWDWRRKNKGSPSNAFYTQNPSVNITNHILVKPKKVEPKKKNSIPIEKPSEEFKERIKESSIIIKKSPCIKKKTLSNTDENSSFEKKAIYQHKKPQIKIKKNCDYNSDEEGKRIKTYIIPSSNGIEGFLKANNDINNHQKLESNDHDKEVFFNSKSLISSNTETNESSVLIKNKDFTTLKNNVFDQEENAMEDELAEFSNDKNMRFIVNQLNLNGFLLQNNHNNDF